MNTRQYYIDWIRVVAFFILILYHTGMFFNSWSWHVKNDTTTSWFDYFMLFFNQWRLPLLFFISGAGVNFALKSRSSAEFIWERTRRLIIPLLFGMFVIVPPQIYFERLQCGQFSGSYLQFYPKVFEFVSYPGGNFSWHHLWFLPYLFSYCLLSLPLLLWLRKEKGKVFISGLLKLTMNRYRIFIFAVPLILVYCLMAPFFPVTNNFVADWYNHAFSFLLFVFGYILGGQISTWEMIENERKYYFYSAVLLTLALYLFFWTDLIPLHANPVMRWSLYALLRILNIWTIILAICGYFKHYLNKPGKFIKYATEAVLPFYILHQSITVSVGYYLAEILIPFWLKFLILISITFLGSWIIYHYIIKPFDFLRLFFGVKMMGSSDKNKYVLRPVFNFLLTSVVLYFSFTLFVRAKREPSIIPIPKIENLLSLDGNINDSILGKAIVFKDFKTLHPRAGLSPSEKTEFSLTYDNKNIYASFTCFDSHPEKIKSLAKNKTNIRMDDWVAFCLYTYSGAPGGYFFMLNPKGLQLQGTLNANDGNTNFDSIFQWTSKATITKSGWTAKLILPFNQLPYNSNETLVMRFKAARYISRLNEEDNFPEMNSTFNYHVARLKKISFKNIDKSIISAK